MTRASKVNVNALDRWLLRRIVDGCGRPPVEMVLWDGEAVHRPRGESHGRIVWRDRGALWAVIRAPELGMGDMFSSGRVEIEGDLIEVLFHCFRCMDLGGSNRMKRDLFGRLPRSASNSRPRSRRHIQHHYDLGNDFYRLWLDEEMVYTCAYFRGADATLRQAQAAKMDHVARKVGLGPGMQVVEAGCGWGSAALHMARCYGVRVRAFNISSEQVAHARERARREGLDDRVEFVEDDYRNMSGTYDAFVSVGMLEHVGVDNYRELGGVVERVLAPHGRGLIHCVGRSRPSAPNAWLEQRIFPGSYPPSLREMMEIFEPNQFSVLDIENLRLHYARTLREWLERFDAHADRVREMYDDEFVRAWRLYLAGCSAAFLSSSIQLFQVVFARPTHNALPRTREHLYRGSEPTAWNLEQA
jgi:cyclopropane-fatty-acyl-phospholipid synthase